LNFVAIDVETANSELESICQIGLVKYVDGNLIEEWSSLIDPEDEYEFMNTTIHGISEEDVIDSPTIPEVKDKLKGYLDDVICVSHTHFDRVAITGVTCPRYVYHFQC